MEEYEELEEVKSKYLTNFKIIAVICGIATFAAIVLPIIKILETSSVSLLQLLTSSVSELSDAALFYSFPLLIILLFSFIIIVVALASSKGRGAYWTSIILGILSLVLVGVFYMFISAGSMLTLGSIKLGIGFWILVIAVVIRLISSIVFLVIDKPEEENLDDLGDYEDYENNLDETVAAQDETVAYDHDDEDETVNIAHKVLIISGQYAGAEIALNDGQKVIIGRDGQKVNLVINDKEISGLHCSIEWSDADKKFHIIDYSKNGVYYDNGIRLPKEQDVQCIPNTTIALANGKNKIILR